MGLPGINLLNPGGGEYLEVKMRDHIMRHTQRADNLIATGLPKESGVSG